MKLIPEILKLIRESDEGLTTTQIAKQLGVDRTQIKNLLYDSLKGQLKQDKKYQWHLISQNNHKIPAQPNVNDSNSTLSKLVRYYQECLSFDNQQGVSTFADGQFDLNYATLNRFPLSEEDSIAIFTSPQVNGLFERMNKERFKKTLYLGYPTSIHSFVAKSGIPYRMVEPIFIFPMEIDSSEKNKPPKFQLQYPQFNFKAMEHLLQSRGSQLLQEIISLGEQLGLNNNSGFIPELDELCLRLCSLSDSWNWIEKPDPNNLNTTHSLRNAKKGIYNHAVIIIGERSGYTVGLESELASLKNKPESNYQNTALGDWLLKTNVKTNATLENTTLLEVLPLNTEQRQAVRSALTQRLTVVTGPPGTGKSQVVTALLVNAAWQGKRVLFASKNHKAVDVVEYRVNGLGPRPILLRLGGKELQERLANYLTKVLGMNPTEEDQQDYEQLNFKLSLLTKKREELEEESELIIKSRNLVDHLDQQNIQAREVFGDTCFCELKKYKLLQDEENLHQFKSAVSKSNHNKQNFFARLFWWAIKKNRFASVLLTAERIQPLIEVLGLDLINIPIDETSIHNWELLSEDLSNRYAIALKTKEYFKALEILSSSNKLEKIDAKLFLLDNQMADITMELWKKWLMLMPKRLSSGERELLGDYSSIIQLMAEAGKGGKMVAREIYIKYKRLFPKVMNILSCWAITSLSAKGRIPLEAGFFDLVVIDEASQCDIASALPLLYRAKQVVIIGDPNQLRHISPVPQAKDSQLLKRYDLLKTHIRYAYSINSLYDLAASIVPLESVINLRDHHRSHADIIEFSNNHFYDGTLRVATRYNQLNLLQKDKPSVRWINVEGDVTRPRDGSALNIPEAEKVISIISDLLLNRKYTGSIGVVSPFRGQVNYIEHLLYASKKLSGKLLESNILVDTVHRFQGDERDLMIFSPVVAKGIQQSSLKFLKGNGNLFNVAITRARSMLIVAGDFNAARNSGVDYLVAFASYAQSLNNRRAQQEEKAKIIELGMDYPLVQNPSQVSEWERWFYKKMVKEGLRPIPQYAEEKYRLDFAIILEENKLNIEVDGERYHRDWNGELCRRDRIRNQRLMELGWDVMRFWVYEIRDETEGCIQRIKNWINEQ